MNKGLRRRGLRGYTMKTIMKDIKVFLGRKIYRVLTIFFITPFILEIIVHSFIFPEPTPFYITHSLQALRTGVSIIMLFLTYKDSKVATFITIILGFHSLTFLFDYTFLLVALLITA